MTICNMARDKGTSDAEPEEISSKQNVTNQETPAASPRGLERQPASYWEYRCFHVKLENIHHKTLCKLSCYPLPTQNIHLEINTEYCWQTAQKPLALV